MSPIIYAAFCGFIIGIMIGILAMVLALNWMD